MSISDENGKSQLFSPDPSDLRQAAKAYLAKGWSILPIKHRSVSGKEPACSSWKQFQESPPTPEQVDKWFARRDLHGLAVICGSVSGNLVCRDFDKVEAYFTWRERFPDLAGSLPTVRTARGFHVYFRSLWKGIAEFDDGELRGGGYCLLPPSRHPRGHKYEWLIPLPEGQLPVVDPEVAGLVRVTERTERQRVQSNRVTESNIKSDKEPFSTHANNCEALEKLIEQAIQASLPQKSGERNRMAFEFARCLKAIPALADANARDLRWIVQKWHARAQK